MAASVLPTPPLTLGPLAYPLSATNSSGCTATFHDVRISCRNDSSCTRGGGIWYEDVLEILTEDGSWSRALRGLAVPASSTSRPDAQSRGALH